MTKHLAAFGMSVLWMACGTDGVADVGPDAPSPDAPVEPIASTPIEQCLAGGGQLAELWSTSNQHGPVTSVAVDGEIVVLGSEDGSVKQWSVDGSEPFYGAPFQFEGVRVNAVAFTGDGHIASADVSGRVLEWALSAPGSPRTSDAGVFEAQEGTSIAGNTQSIAIARKGAVADIRIVERATGTVGDALSTTLWGSNAVAFSAGTLFTAGHFYGNPMIERRATAAPSDVVDAWSDQTKLGQILSIAVDRAGTRLAAGGQNLVAVLDPTALEAGPVAFASAEGHDAVATVLLGRELFATAGSEGTLRVWSGTAQPLQSLTIPAPVGLGLDGAGTTLFTSGPDGLLHAFGCRLQ